MSTENGKIFRIAWDCDGVLAESHIPLLEAANKKISQYLNREVKILKSDLIEHNELTRKTLALTGDQDFANEVTKFWHTPSILRISPPNPATIEVFNRCQKLSDTTQCVITTRQFQNEDVTREWLEQYLPTHDWKQNLYIRKESDSMNGEEFKILRLENINCMIEDNPITITNINRDRPHCQTIYINQPWNQLDSDEYRSQFRVDFDDVEAIYERILKIREKFLLG